MSYNWGPHYLVPSTVTQVYSGIIQLREQLDEELLQKELKDLGIRGHVKRINNPWYYRKKETTTWIQIGESDDKANNFPATWNTRVIDNGEYEVLGLMHVYAGDNENETVIARQNIVSITIKN